MVGERIRSIREQKEMTMVELSEKSGVSQGALSLIESGKRTPGRVTLRKIADGLGVELSEIASQDVIENMPSQKLSEYQQIMNNAAIRKRIRESDIVIEIDNVVFTIDIKAFVRSEEDENYDSVLPKLSANIFGKAFEKSVSTVIERYKDEIMGRFMDEMDRVRNEFEYRISSITREISENKYRFNKDGDGE